MHNSVKHSKAGEITVTLEEKENCVLLLVKDNGIGIDYEEKKENNQGFGLRSLKSRAELMQGTMQVESREGLGTAFLFRLPLP